MCMLRMNYVCFQKRATRWRGFPPAGIDIWISIQSLSIRGIWNHQIDHSICGPQADFFPPIAIVCLFVVLKYVLLRSLGDITLWISKSLWLKPPWFLLSISVWTFSARLNFQFLLYSQTWNWCWPSLRLLVVTFPRLLNLAVFVGFNLQSKIFSLWLTYV